MRDEAIVASSLGLIAICVVAANALDEKAKRKKIEASKVKQSA